ncbi:hypothetical protein CR513_43858, partial [Mucuna pruriens]
MHALKITMYLLNRIPINVYNPYEQKLYVRTISGFFICYLEKPKGYIFYCPNHSTRIVEYGNTQFIKNGQFNGKTHGESSSPKVSSQDVAPLVVLWSNNTQRQQNPTFFVHAIKSDNYEKWLNAMKEELKSMDDNKVWDIVELLEGLK